MTTQQTRTPTRRRGMLGKDRAMRVALPLVALLAILAIWQAVTAIFRVPAFLLPSPLDVAQSYVQFQAFLWQNTWVTLGETLAGFLLAIVIGIPIATLISSSRTIEAAIYPILLGINAVPKIAIAPLLVVWMGFGFLPKIVMVFLVCFFPIVISTATGLRSTATELNELAKSLGASPLHTFLKVRFLWAMPQIFVGLKTAISLAVIGAVIGEFVGASEGLGYVIVQSGASANTALAFAAMGLLGVMSIVLFYGLTLIEKALIPWAEDNE